MIYICRNCRAVKRIKELMSISKDKSERIPILYNQGMSSIAIARKLGIGKFTVLKYLRQEGITRRPCTKHFHHHTVISDTDAAWLAGFIDGEGYIGIHGNKLSLSISNANQESILYVKDLAGGGSLFFKKNSAKNPKWSDICVVRIIGQSLRHIIKHVAKYCIVKKKHIILCEQWFKLQDQGKGRENKSEFRNKFKLLSRDGFKIKMLNKSSNIMKI